MGEALLCDDPAGADRRRRRAASVHSERERVGVAEFLRASRRRSAARSSGAAPRGRQRLHDPGGLRVLVVEDQPMVRELLCELVQSWGYLVEAVGDLASAAPRVGGAAVVLLDLQLPDGEGLSLLPRVQASPSPASVIVTTGYGTVENAIQALHEGAFGFLLKPVRPPVLRSMVARAAQAYRERRDLELHRDILDAVQDVILAGQPGAPLSYFNDGAAIALGRSGAELSSATLDQLVELPARDGSGEYATLLADGGRGVVEGTWTSLPTEGDGEPTRVLVGRDITRERQAQRDLVRSGALAELGMMLAEAAHELNNPAAFVLANLTTLQEDLDAGELDLGLAKEMVRECMEGVGRITRMVGQLRNLTRAQIEERPEAVQLAQVVRDSLHIARVRVGRRASLHLVVEAEVDVMAMPGRLSQAVMNLVVNAADALEGQQSPAPVIEVVVGRAELDGLEFARIDVQDNGPGVPESLRGRLFEPFMTSKADGSGTGLGLPISRSFVEDLGGRLTLLRSGPAGACFRVALPLPGGAALPVEAGGAGADPVGVDDGPEGAG